MLSIYIILFVIVSCGARELESSTTTPDDFSINPVELSTQKPDTESRIIGGTATSIEKYPYTVQVLYYMQLTCAGSLLTRRLVLSAGHCFVDQNGSVVSPRAFAIRVGTSYLNSGGTVYYVSAIVVHERYNQPLRDNDVAVLLLRSSVTLSASVQTARIPAAGARLADDSTVVVVGWGRTNADIPVASNVFNEVSVRTVNRSVCAERYEWLQNITSDSYPITDSMLCAGLLDIGGADACQGDSGGPLLYGDIVVGVTSWGYGCAHPLLPGVYAKVSSYTNWVNQTVSRYGYGNGATNIHSAFVTLFMPLVFLILSI